MARAGQVVCRESPIVCDGFPFADAMLVAHDIQIVEEGLSESERTDRADDLILFRIHVRVQARPVIRESQLIQRRTE